MNEALEEEFDIDSEDAVGSSIELRDNFSQTWKRALVTDVDLDEREILVTFDNGSQEWISTDRYTVRLFRDPGSENNCQDATSNTISQSGIWTSSNQEQASLDNSVDDWDGSDLKQTVQEIIENKKKQQEDYKELKKCLAQSVPDIKAKASDAPLIQVAAAEKVTEVKKRAVRLKKMSSVSFSEKTSPKKTKKSTSSAAVTLSKMFGIPVRKSPLSIEKPHTPTEPFISPLKEETVNQITSLEDTTPKVKKRAPRKKKNSINYVQPLQDADVSVGEEKLPSLKIKLTRSFCGDGSTKPDTFVVTESTADPNIAKNMALQRDKHGRFETNFRKRKIGPVSERSSKADSFNFEWASDASFEYNDMPSVPLYPDVGTGTFNDVKTDIFTTSQYNSPYYSEQESILQPPEKKRVKILLPKVRGDTSQSYSNVAETPSPSPVAFRSPPLPSLSSTPSGLVSSHLASAPKSNSTEASVFYCPKKDCRKQFRRENLLMMHIKHYHTEYKKLLRSTPNVADLAYARTTGQNIESPQSEFLQKISKLEEDRCKQEQRSDDSINNDIAKSESYNYDSNISRLYSEKSVCKEEQMDTSNAEYSHLTTSVKEERVSTFTAAPVSPVESRSQALLQDKRKKKAQPSAVNRDIVNCICGYGDEDGLMIQCEICLCWQHGSCFGIERESDVPPDYVCEICKNPRRQHSSKKYSYLQHWFTEGRLPTYDVCKTDTKLLAERQKYLKESHSLLGRLVSLQNVLHTLNLKNHIMGQVSDHPKLYLWSKPWNEKKLEEENKDLSSRKNASDGPVPEAAINMKVCRKNLCEHIEEEIDIFETNLAQVEKEIEDMEYDSAEELDEFFNMEIFEQQEEDNIRDDLREISANLACV